MQADERLVRGIIFGKLLRDGSVEGASEKLAKN